MNRRRRAVLLAATVVAWAGPTLLAMWLDARRILEPAPDPMMETYARNFQFQYMAFWIRFGWVLLLLLAVVLATQVGMTGVSKPDSAQEK